MLNDPNIKRLDGCRLEVLPSFKAGMKTSAIIYADEEIERYIEAAALDQMANAAALPGLAGHALAMPDIHTGYGFPIGGVAAFFEEGGVISPGAVGYDINCGVRLLAGSLELAGVERKLEELGAALQARVPAGLGAGGGLNLDKRGQEAPLIKGAAWAVERGLGRPEDLVNAESGGAMAGADPHAVSHKALERGRGQLGTLGSGNHFLEIQEVTGIYDEAAARAFGLFKGQLTVMIHTGSRGLGHQVCTDYAAEVREAAGRYGIAVPDRELAAVPLASPEGRRYFGAMQAAANYAWANRQALTALARETLGAVLGMGERALDLRLVYDVAHNIAKLETHDFRGRPTRVIVHRKGATRAFAPGHPELPEAYRCTGQPVIIPGDMGRRSYMLAGRAGAATFGSACHGAGRLLSRHEAIRRARGRDIEAELSRGGVWVRSAQKGTLAEEMPEAYKDVDAVVRVVEGAGIARRVAAFRPVVVIKG